MSRNARALAIAIFSLGCMALCLTTSSAGVLSRDVSQALIFISGVFLMLLVGGLQVFLNEGVGQRGALGFSPGRVRDSLATIELAEYTEVAEPVSGRLPYGGFEATGDPVLSLALIRVEMEHQLRRIAKEAGVREGLSLIRLIERLATEGVIPYALASAARDVLPAANRAVHGLDLGTTQTGQLIEIGREVVRLFSGLSGSAGQEERATEVEKPVG